MLSRVMSYLPSGVTRSVQLHLAADQIQSTETPSALNSAHPLALPVSFGGRERGELPRSMKIS